MKDTDSAYNAYKINLVVSRLIDICKQLPYKQANLLSYCLNPRYTAIGAGFSYNRETLYDSLREALSRQLAVPDANSQFTLNRVCDMIVDEEI